MTITFESKAFKAIMDKLNFLEAAYKAQHARYGLSKYMSEEQVMQVTELGKDSLRKYRHQGILTGKTSSGKKIQYLRKEIEAYLNGDLADKIFAARLTKKLQQAS